MSYPADPYRQPPGFADPASSQPQYGYTQPGYGYQPTGAANLPVAGYAEPLVNIGSIVVTATEVITPGGRIPLAQANFGFIDQTMRIRKTPTWAIITAIVGFFIIAVFSLFFLLAKEDAVSGHVMITVTGNGVQHQEYLPISQDWQLQDTYGRMQYAQNLVMANRV